MSWSVAGVLVSKWCPSTKIYDLLPVSWSRSPSTKMYDLLTVSWSRSGAPELRCTICCWCRGLEVVPQHEDVRFVDGVLVSKWCPITKIYDLLPVSWFRSGAPARGCTICCRCLGLLPVSWSRSGAPALRCTMFCRYLGVEVVPQHKHVRFVAGVLVSKSYARNDLGHASFLR